MDAAYLKIRITVTKTRIEAYEAALLAVVADGAQSYKLDTGQTVTWVTKIDVPAMEKTLQSLYNLCTTMQVRLNGTGVVIGKPGW